MSSPVQVLPIAYRLVYAGCLPLRGRRGHVPALQGLFRLSWCVFRVRIARPQRGRGCAAVRAGGALRMRRTPCGYCGCNLVQELPTAYKPVRLYCLPLTRSARPVVVPYEYGTHPRRRARRLGAPVQELPTAYKPFSRHDRESGRRLTIGSPADLPQNRAYRSGTRLLPCLRTNRFVIRTEKPESRLLKPCV